MDNEAGSTLYDLILKRWQYALENVRSLHDAAETNLKLVHSWEHRKEYGYIDNVDPAVGFRQTETERAYLRCNVLEPGITATREEDAEKAAAMNNIVKADYSTAKANAAMDNYYYNMIVEGTGALKLGWSFEESIYWRWVKDDDELSRLAVEAAEVMSKTAPEESADLQTVLATNDIKLLREYLATGAVKNIQPEPGHTGFKVQDLSQSDGPRFEIVPIFDLAWLGSGPTIRDCDSVFRRFYVTTDEVLRWKTNDKSWINLDAVLETCGDADGVFGQRTSTAQTMDMVNGRSIMPSMMVEFIEETRRDPLTGEIWETVINIPSSKIVRHRKLPYFHNELPYFSIRIFGDVSDFAGISLLTPAESLIGEYIKLTNEICENGDLAINKVFMTRIGARQPAPQLHVYSGNLIAVDSYEDIKPLDIPDIRPATLQLLQHIKAEIEEITGCPSILNAAHGDTSGANAGFLEQLQFYQTARFAAAQHQIAVELSAMTMQLVKLHQQYDYQGRRVYIEDEREGGRWVYYEPAEFAGQFEANSDPRSMLPTNNAVKRAQLLSAFNVLGKAKVAAKDPETQQPVQTLILNPLEMTKEVLGTFDILNNKHLFNKRGDISGIDPDALPAVPTVPKKPEAPTPDDMTDEDKERFEQASEQTGIPVKQLVAEAQQALEEGVAQAQMPQEIQGGAQVPPELAQQINARDFSPMPGGGGNGVNTADTLTGTDGMPPIKGGTQQSGSYDPNTLANPSTQSDAVQSALNIQ